MHKPRLRGRLIQNLRAKYLQWRRDHPALNGLIDVPILSTGSDSTVMGRSANILNAELLLVSEDGGVGLILDPTSICTNGKDQSLTLAKAYLINILEHIDEDLLTLTIVDDMAIIITPNNGDARVPIMDEYALIIGGLQDEEEEKPILGSDDK